jgi:hypothetical protein
MKKGYIFLFSATLSVLSLQINSVDAATTDNNNQNLSEKVQSKEQNQNTTATSKNLDSDVNNGFQTETKAPTYNALVSNKTVDSKQDKSAKETTTDQMKTTTQATVTKNVVKESDHYQQMLQSWKDVVVGDSYYDKSNPEMTNVGAQQDTNVTKLWKSMDKDDQRKNPLEWH